MFCLPSITKDQDRVSHGLAYALHCYFLIRSIHFCPPWYFITKHYWWECHSSELDYVQFPTALNVLSISPMKDYHHQRSGRYRLRAGGMTGFSIIFVFAVRLSISELFLWSSHTQLPLKINCIFPAYLEKRNAPLVDTTLALAREGKKEYGSFYPVYSMEDIWGTYGSS